MVGMMRTKLFVSALCLLCIGPPSLEAKDKLRHKARGEFGIVVGSLSAMTIELESKESPGRTSDFDTDGGFTAALFFEQPTFFGLWAGVSIDYLQLHKDLGSVVNGSQAALGLALRLSTRLTSQSGEWVFRPGIGSGVALFPEVYTVATSQYWTLTPFAEILYRASPKVGIIGQVSILNTLWGGNDDYNISAGPAVLLRLGVVIKCPPALGVKNRLAGSPQDIILTGR